MYINYQISAISKISLNVTVTPTCSYIRLPKDFDKAMKPLDMGDQELEGLVAVPSHDPRQYGRESPKSWNTKQDKKDLFMR